MPRHRAHQLLRLIHWLRFIERFWGLRGKNKRRRVLVRLARAVLSRLLHRWNWHRWGNTFQCDPIRTLFEWLKWQKLFEWRTSQKHDRRFQLGSLILYLLDKCRSWEDEKLQEQINAMVRRIHHRENVWHRRKSIHPASKHSRDTRRTNEPIQHLDRRNLISFLKQRKILQRLV